MNKPFIHDDWLLDTDAARELYHGHAAAMPVLDYHCHLSPREIAEDRRWDNLAQLWLGGDHYKWRALRSNGVDERLVTGGASDWEKFEAFAASMPYFLRNPIYDWSHLELARYFGVYDLLSPKTAASIWKNVNAQLAQVGASARGFMRKANVRLVCTTDDPADTLEHHAAIRASGFEIKVLPTWRPDKAWALHKTAAWNAWQDRLAATVEMDIRTYDDLLAALKKQHDFFASMGCRLSDYGPETVGPETATHGEARALFARARDGGTVDAAEASAFRNTVMLESMRMDAAADWAMQIHYGAMRDNNTRMLQAVGPDTGFDSMGDRPVARGLSRLLDRLDAEDALPRTLLFTLNPRDNEMLGAMLGNFQRGPVPGKMQLGAAWWFNDHLDGMTRHLEALSGLGLLSRFVGMLTDSRSFVSYPRHEYFRRILCNLLGRDIASGRLPDDRTWVGELVRDISCRNAARWFKFDGIAEV